ncbi:MAG: hypothetical protein ACLGHV_01595, partial [Gammaproteobacteria bacterium]
HFVYEERIAGDAGVPQGELNLHKREHEAYRERMRTFQHAFSENDKRAPVQLMAFCRTGGCRTFSFAIWSWAGSCA